VGGTDPPCGCLLGIAFPLFQNACLSSPLIESLARYQEENRTPGHGWQCRLRTFQSHCTNEVLRRSKPTIIVLVKRGWYKRESFRLSFRIADHTPGIIAAANGTFVRLRDHDQPVGVCVAFPGILDLGERNTFGLDAQCAAGYTVHHLLERVSEYVPRRHASGS
jgi:hypothetical protein